MPRHRPTPAPGRLRPLTSGVIALFAVASSGCGTKRLAVAGPLDNAPGVATALQRSTVIDDRAWITFTWQLNESGSRVRGEGVARIESPYHARLDLFLDNGETVIAAALVDNDLRIPPGAPDDVLPPVELMWGTLGIFRPLDGTRLTGGDRLEGQSRRLRYAHADGRELHYEIRGEELRAVELLQGESVVEWVRLERQEGDRYPATATYRNLVDFRELKITRTGIRGAEPFDPAIWNPRE